LFYWSFRDEKGVLVMVKNNLVSFNVEKNGMFLADQYRMREDLGETWTCLRLSFPRDVCHEIASFVFLEYGSDALFFRWNRRRVAEELFALRWTEERERDDDTVTRTLTFPGSPYPWGEWTACAVCGQFKSIPLFMFTHSSLNTVIALLCTRDKINHHHHNN